MYDELIKRLRERCVFLFPHHGESRSYDADLMHEAADAIEELSRDLNSAGQTIANLTIEKAVCGDTSWIPVTERLPKSDEYDARGYAVPYLVMNGWMRVTARRTKDYWVLFGEGTVLEYVTHWMPLPEPPKEE